MILKMFEYTTGNPYLQNYQLCGKFAYEAEIVAIKNGPLGMLSSESKVQEAISDVMMDDYRLKEPYCVKILSFAAKSHPIFLVVDNVDQIEDPEIQSEIFLEATALSRELRSNLVLAMRDATYVKNRSSAVFDAFDFDAVYIDSPRIIDVLMKRFDVADELLKGKSFEFRSDNGSNIKVSDSRLVVSLLRDSIQKTEVGRILEIAATGDTRLALRMTRQFLQYGYSSTSRAVEIYQRTGTYRLPAHEALRAIMLGNQNIYREQLSAIGNPFDAYLGRSDVQLLRLYVLSASVEFSSEREFDGISVQNIVDTLERIGVDPSASEQVLKDLVRHRYLFSRSHKEYSKESMLIPSRLAGFVCRDLIGRMAFLETTLFDTFIGDNEVWEAIRENMKLVYREKNLIRKLGVRREIVIEFFEWLDFEMQKMVSEARSRNLSPQWCVNPVNKIRHLFESDISRAYSSAVFNYGTAEDFAVVPTD